MHCSRVVQWLSCIWIFATPWTVLCLPPLSSTIFQSLLKFMPSESVMLSNNLIIWCLLLLLSSVFPSIRVFSSESTLHQTKYWRWPLVWPSIGTSASITVLPMNIQGWFSLGLTDLICLQSKGLSRIFFSTTIQKHQFFNTQPSL